MTSPIWMYWEGDCPEWIKACHQTVFAHGSDVRLLAWNDFDLMRDTDRDIDLIQLCTAHRADFIRAFLMARCGGLWIDSDCIVMRSLQPVLDLLEHYDFVGYKERQGHVANNFMCARPGSKIASQYYRRVCSILRSGQALSWLTLGAYALTDTIRAAGVSWCCLDCELVQPICWSNPAAFFMESEHQEHHRIFNQQSICYMLSNNMIRGFQAEHPNQDLMAENTFFTYLLWRAVKNTE
jgi:hypothetical protein